MVDTTSILLVLGSVFVGAVVLGTVMWLFWIRRFLRKKNRAVSTPYFIIGALMDFVSGLEVSREHRHSPWFLKLFAVLLMVAVGDLVLVVLILWFGVR